MSRNKRKGQAEYQRKAKFKKKVSKELEELKKRAELYEEFIRENKKDKIKQFHIRNLKIFKSTCKLIAPFALTTGITVGAFHILGAGLPFHTDKITLYKACSLDYKSNGYTEIEEFYRTNRWYDNPLPESSLTMYTPWEKDNGNYIRYKREYKFDRPISMELINALLNSDIDYIKSMDSYTEEMQITNKQGLNTENIYEISANLHTLNKEDKIKYDESNTKNIIITSIELAIISVAFGIYLKKSDYNENIRKIIREYQSKLESYKENEEELANINKKILVLSKKMRK